MFADLPPQTFMRVLSTEYFDSYVDGVFCESTENLGTVYRVDVHCPGERVEFRSADGLVVAELAWENWRLVVL